MMPAGIEDGIEVYKVENRVRAMMEGIRIEYSNLPDRIRSIFRKELYSDKKVIDNLRLMGITEPEEMEKTYVGCRYGAMDGTPDMKGVQTKSDAPSCKELSKCPGYGSVCRIPENLTRQEYQVAVFIGRGKMDKEICDIMNIAQPTLRTYIARIHDKLSINNRIEIALWAQNLSIC